jgi:hypothetical protein
MSAPDDRLFDLLPPYLRTRDAEVGFPLRALLRIVAEQVAGIEADVDGLYDNWFIETCDDWVVPYIAELIGYRPATDPASDVTAPAQALSRIVFPRREVANTIGDRRRKGTIALLESIAGMVSGWPSKAVEGYRLVAVTQHINHLQPDRGRLVDLRRGDQLDAIGGAFDPLSRTADLRRPNSTRSRGLANVTDVLLHVWRMASYPITRSPAHHIDHDGSGAERARPGREPAHSRFRYTFSLLGNDTPLTIRPRAGSLLDAPATPRDVPMPIRRRFLQDHLADLYGPGKSLQVYVGGPAYPVPIDRIVVADLTGWHYQPSMHQVAVDPELGRIALAAETHGNPRVWVSYYYGTGGPIGGGGYHRKLEPPTGSLYRVGKTGGFTFSKIGLALEAWARDEYPDGAIVEIGDSAVYAEELRIVVPAGRSLELRAADLQRPMIEFFNFNQDASETLVVTGERPSDDKPQRGGRLTIDGLLIGGRGVEIGRWLDSVTFRHCTLIPGWSLGSSGSPGVTEPSVVICGPDCSLKVQNSIIGPIEVRRRELAEASPIVVTDSILDALDPSSSAVFGTEGCNNLAHAELTVERSTFLGETLVHEVRLAQDSLFVGPLLVGRRTGCVRYCYVAPGSRTPRRFACQPDAALDSAKRDLGRDLKTAEQNQIVRRVRPIFESVHFGTPPYAILSDACPDEIAQGAQDRSEMGAFHDLFRPQREAILLARLEGYTPAGLDAGVVFHPGDPRP